MKALEMVRRACPVCGTADDSSVYAEADFDPSRWDAFAFASRKLPEYMHYRLVRCRVCDVLYADPVPTLDALASAYREAGFDSSEEARYAARTYAGLLDRFAARLPDRSGALDIGTGDGVFLEQLLERGFTGVTGVEPSEAPIAAARDDIRPLIRKGLFDPGDFTPGSFSLITCFQTIEHLYSPLEMCQAAHGLLKDGGALFLIGHDYRGLSARLLKLRSPIFDIEHLQLFSLASARRMLERAGFSDIEVRPIVNRYPLSYWLKLFPLPMRAKTALLARLKGSAIGALPVALPVGNLAAVGFKRGAGTRAGRKE